MSEITIASAADYPHLIPLLGRWYWEEWGPFEPERSLANWIAMLAPRTLRDEIPTIYVALAAGPLHRQIPMQLREGVEDPLHRQIPMPQTLFIGQSQTGERAGETPVGTASLIAADMSTHPELSPWLAGVYVVPEYRRQGIGRALVHRVVSTAAALGVPRLYLFTDSKQRWYANLGWVEIGREPYQGREVAIMCISNTGSV